GWKSYRQLPINLMPDISYPTLTVRTEYEGAAPEDVEKLVTRPLEETLSIVGGMVEISSISSPGTSEIVLEFTWGTDMNNALQEVRDRLDLFDPPKEVTEKPVILRYDPTLDPVMRVAIRGQDFSEVADPVKRTELQQNELTAIREAAERHIKSDLEAETGIAQVLIKGGRKEEIQVLVDAGLLKNVGLSFQAVESSLAQQNINLSGGRLREGKTEYLVRTLNEFQDIAEIGKSIIGAPNGQQIRLADVAQVFLGKKERETIVKINGVEAVAMDIFKDGDANTVQVCNKLKDTLGFKRDPTWVERAMALVAKRGAEKAEGEVAAQDEKKEENPLAMERGQSRLARTIRSHLPRTAEFSLISDQSRFIVESIREVKAATIGGGILALLVLFLFLRDVKSTAVIGIAIPISLITAFTPMFMRGISINIMSLGGLALGVGMLVDNSIVVLESIFRCREEGDNIKDAAERGTREVGGAVTSSTLTTVAVFFPITFVEGIAGQIFGDLALTVTFSLLASLLVALYLNPMMVSRERAVFRGGEDVIWALRAYREGRSKRGLIGAVAGIFPRGFHYGWRWLKETAADMFGPTVATFRNRQDKKLAMNLLSCITRVVFLPFVALVFVLQVALKILAAIFVTILFLVSLVLMAIFLVVRTILRILLWLPLTLFDAGLQVTRRVYGATLRVALQFSPLFLIATAALAVHSGYVATQLGRELIPPLKQGEFGIRMEAPPGTRIEETAKLAQRIEDIITARPEVDTVAVEIGQEKTKAGGERGENVAQFNVLLKNPDENARHQEVIIEELRREIQRVSSDQNTFTLPTLFSFKTAIELQIRGDDLEQLKLVGYRVIEALRGTPGLKDAELSVKKGYPEVIIELDRDLLAAKGLSALQVAQRLRAEVQGNVATRFSRMGEKIDIRVRANQERLSSLDDLRAVSVVDGTPPVSLDSVATITIKDGPSEIRRVDQRQVVLVRANVEGLDLGAVANEIDRRLATVEKPEEYSFVPGGQNRELQTSYKSLQFALLLAIFLVYVVMACQFESLIHPALVMATVPLAFIGVVYVLAWQSISLSIVVFIGGIILAGIVVNDGIVIVDYINQLRGRGMTKREAIIQAGQVRLRPVLMTTVTTVLGLIPMAVWTGAGAEMRQPLALTVMAGLSSATILTLLIIPMVYYVFGGRDKPRKAES
ncbi:MAG: AcrB/AcrD/AcrF family protein, partial [Nitrospiraceae bacterium]|nr:AcrB/AcrD/AcrF family protein [Nitrospiraceae bacterium]